VSRLIPFVIFFAIACTILGGGHYYLWARLVRDTGLPPWASRLATSAIVGLGVALPTVLVASSFVQGRSVRPVTAIVFTWMGAGFILTALVFATDLLRWSVLGAGRLAAPALSAELASPARRLLFARLLAAVSGSGAALMTASGLRAALAAIDVRELDVRIPGLPAALDGFRLVQLSDLHLGPILGRDWLAGVVSRARGLRPDLVAITGDLVDGSVEQLAPHVEPLRALADVPHGVFFVTGNHEYYSGVDEWLAHLPSLGVRPLRNERVEVAPGLDLAGIDDPTGRPPGHGPDLRKALAGRDPARALVLLAHQPRQFFEAAEHKVPLTLVGHTHGGQLWPFSWLVHLLQPFVAGLHRKGDSWLYVSRGAGFWGPPLRVGAPAEITLVRLRA
jgi:predicted MPP superfamily phosphohydrolase